MNKTVPLAAATALAVLASLGLAAVSAQAATAPTTFTNAIPAIAGQPYITSISVVNGPTDVVGTLDYTGTLPASYTAALYVSDQQAAIQKVHQVFGAGAVVTDGAVKLTTATIVDGTEHDTNVDASVVGYVVTPTAITITIPHSMFTWTGDLYPSGAIAVGGQFAYAGSASTASDGPVPFTVVEQAPDIALALSSPSTVYKHSSATVTATVTPALGGSVQFRDGKKVLASASLVNGVAKAKLSKKLKLGKHAITAVYLSPRAAQLATSATSVLRVGYKTTTNISLSKSKQTFGKKAAKLTVRTSGKLSGKAVVYDGGAKIDSVKVKHGRGHVTLPKKLDRGKHHIRVVFTPTSSHRAVSNSKTVTLKVK